MAYIGKSPAVGNFIKLDAITTSATATYNLLNGGVAYSPESVNHMLVSLNGVIQSPTTAFTVSGSTIIFASTLSSSDAIDFIMVYGDVLNLGVPSDATVTNAKIVDMAASKLTGALPAISGASLTSLNAANIGSGTVPTARLGTGSASSSVFLSGANTWIAAGGGKILQVVQDIKTDTASIASTTPAAISGLTLDITPATSSSKILLMCSLGGVGHQTADLKTYFKFYGGNTATYLGDSGTGYECAMTVWNGQAGYAEQNGHMSYLDSPATTSAVTYTVYWWNSSGTSYINRTHTHNTESANTACSLIAMEVGA